MGSSRMIVSVLVECRYTEQCAIPPFVARKEPTEPVEQVSIRNRVDLRKIGIFAKKNELTRCRIWPLITLKGGLQFTGRVEIERHT